MASPAVERPARAMHGIAPTGEFGFCFACRRPPEVTVGATHGVARGGTSCPGDAWHRPYRGIWILLRLQTSLRNNCRGDAWRRLRWNVLPGRCMASPLQGNLDSASL